MAKRRQAGAKTETTPPAGSSVRASEPGPVTFGGSLVREMGSLPGMMGKFVTISRKYPRAHFIENRPAMSAAFSHVNADTVVDDYGKEWPPASLLHLGSDGRDEGEFVFLVHKFIPIAALYSPAPFAWLSGGERF